MVKRIFDFVAALVLVVILSPVLLLTAVVAALTMGCPIVFRQERPGKGGRLFTLYKFRTMRSAIGADGRPLDDSQRLTSVGKTLRSSSLDELPELWNVIKGEMSLVGPRPLLVEYLPRYSPEQARRHEVLPGITGWAQVNGRNAITWEQKFALDLWYVDNRSLLLDMEILAMTLRALIKRTGISARGHATMPEFEGTTDERTDN